MEAKANLKYLRISPRKVQIVCDLIRGKSVAQANAILMGTPKAASELLQAPQERGVQRREQPQDGPLRSCMCPPAIANPRPHHQAHHAPGSGPRLPDQQAYFSHHHCCELSAKGGGTIWDRKLIPTDCAWVSSRIGTPVGMPATRVGDLLVEDKKIRDYLKKTLYGAGIPKIEIERDNAKVRVYLHCARPGMVIGKGGEDIEKLRLNLEKMLGKSVALNIVEVKSPDMNAQLVAENIAQQLEKRIGFRRAMKNAMGRAMRAGALGIKTLLSGRLGGAEIARTEHYHDGTIPLQTLRADIDYGFAEAATTYGRIGVKVWVYKGEVLTQTLRTTPRTLDTKNFKERPGPSSPPRWQRRLQPPTVSPAMATVRQGQWL